MPLNNDPEKKVTIVLAPTLALAEGYAGEHYVDATVEAEYGDICIEGKKATLAHHGPRSGNPAPCNAEVDPLNGERTTILLSHIDLDALGGIMALTGEKPDDKEFWKAAEYIDVNGSHHMHDLPQNVQDKLNAFYAVEDGLREEEGPVDRSSISDVTEAVAKRVSAVEIILDERHPEHGKYISAGKEWVEKIEAAVEQQHICDTKNARVFITEGPFTAASYYSPENEKIMPATVTFNKKFDAITVAFADGGNADGDKNARKIVQSLWGKEAGGREGIAGSPRGKAMTLRDLVKAVEAVEEAVEPVTSKDRAYEMGDIREYVSDAIREEVQERDLGLDTACLDGHENINRED